MSSLLMAEDEDIRGRYNEAVEAIVGEIIKTKSGYPELEGFTRSVISPDPSGFSSVFFMHDTAGNSQDPYAYQLSINAKPLGAEEIVPEDGSVWIIKFPLLDLKVAIESRKKGPWTSFDMKKIVESHMEGLKSLEQKFLPFRLELKAQGESFQVYEDITITAILKNTGQKAFQVADLGENSLYCKIGQGEWGTREATPELNKVLNANASIAKILRVYGMESPQELWISCTYAIAFKGVRPYNRIKVTIKPES